MERVYMMHYQRMPLASDLSTHANLVGSQTLTYGTGTIASKDVGSNKTVSRLEHLALADGSNGGLAANYTLT
jgi:hypothetical protein